MISEDAETWTNKTIPLGGSLAGATFGNGKFVAVGDNGVGATSSDNGDSWTATGTGGQIQRSVAYGNGRFASVGTDGRVTYSENGIQWTSRRLNGPTPAESRPFFNRVLFSNGDFYATTLFGSLYSSANGFDWNILHTGINVDLYAMAAGNGLLLLGGGHEIHLVTMPNTGGPTVTEQPKDTTAAQGGTAMIAAGISGADLELTWRRNGQPLAQRGGASPVRTARP